MKKLFKKLTFCLVLVFTLCSTVNVFAYSGGVQPRASGSGSSGGTTPKISIVTYKPQRIPGTNRSVMINELYLTYEQAQNYADDVILAPYGITATTVFTALGLVPKIGIPITASYWINYTGAALYAKDIKNNAKVLSSKYGITKGIMYIKETIITDPTKGQHIRTYEIKVEPGYSFKGYLEGFALDSMY